MMKAIILTSIAVFFILQTGCERHSAEVTVKGYAEKMAAKKAKAEEKATTDEPVQSPAPSFFPSPSPTR